MPDTGLKFAAKLVLCAALGLTAARADAQEARTPAVGVLVTHAPLNDPVMTSIKAGLQSLGYEDGRTIRLDFVTANGQLEQLPAMAKAMVERKVDVILAPNELAARTVRQVSKTVPIVMVAFGADPVQSGLIESLRRPGGNITGIYSLAGELQPKMLEILKEAIPTARKVAVFWDPKMSGQLDSVQRAALQLKQELVVIEVSGADQLEPTVRKAKAKKVDAAIFLSSPIFYVNRRKVAELLLTHRLPAITPYSQLVDSGLLLSYGNDLDAVYRRMGYYVDRILKGTPASELPVEQVMRLTLAANFKTAKTLGITLPETILVRVDHAIK